MLAACEVAAIERQTSLFRQLRQLPKGSDREELKKAFDLLPVDPFFEPFLESIRQPDDPLSNTEIVVVIRSAMRKDLGLSGGFSI